MTTVPLPDIYLDLHAEVVRLRLSGETALSRALEAILVNNIKELDERDKTGNNNNNSLLQR